MQSDCQLDKSQNSSELPRHSTLSPATVACILSGHSLAASSVSVCWYLILASCFLIMAPFAKRLPIALIPKEFRVSPVRDDVVHNSCRGCDAFLQTLRAERVELQELLTLPAPTAVVPTACCRPAIFRVHRLVLLTVLLSGFYQLTTAGNSHESGWRSAMIWSQGFFPSPPSLQNFFCRLRAPLLSNASFSSCKYRTQAFR